MHFDVRRDRVRHLVDPLHYRISFLNTYPHRSLSYSWGRTRRFRLRDPYLQILQYAIQSIADVGNDLGNCCAASGYSDVTIYVKIFAHLIRVDLDIALPFPIVEHGRGEVVRAKGSRITGHR